MPDALPLVLLLYALVAGTYFLVGTCRHLAEPEAPVRKKLTIREDDVLRLPGGVRCRVIGMTADGLRVEYSCGGVRCKDTVVPDDYFRLLARAAAEWPTGLPPAHDVGGEGG